MSTQPISAEQLASKHLAAILLARGTNSDLKGGIVEWLAGKLEARLSQL